MKVICSHSNACSKNRIRSASAAAATGSGSGYSFRLARYRGCTTGEVGTPEADFSAWARSCGGFGTKVTESGDAAGAIAQALTHDGPALVDVDVNPNEPPMPGKVSYDQAKSFAQAFLKGQPHKAAIATTLFKDRIQKLGD
ncbi:hypothetical protein LDL08_35900 [Nonomuraea glycinis]|uniref:thiamine pyrophosphate-dependent enzyme n=1 Tax=Nonomuraea glycinis TaxID=2047744 RepID=UPI00166D2D04|nr:thiamine pyrophosphate-dependent enzyme [Nonomuraea glycinis]MCA2181557.1 hypothetical protein [Nonomuraea glycinis]